MPTNLTTKLPAVLITGCSSGLGEALAIKYAKAGYPTYATARNLSAIEHLANFGCHLLQLDVTDNATIKATVEQVELTEGSVGILINNAAIGIMTPIETIEITELRRQYETNVFGLLAVTQAVMPAMRKAGKGRIVNIGSSGGEFTTPGGGAYQATKYALDSMTDAMRMEFGIYNIDVVLIEPGAISSKFAQNGAVLGTDAGPYKQLMRGVSKVAMSAVKPGAPGTWTPAQVAKTVFKASLAKKPKARYRPGIVAKALIHLKRSLPTLWWDKMFISWLMGEGKKVKP